MTGRFFLYMGSDSWLERVPVPTMHPSSYVKGATFGDVDGDSDLDLVVTDDFSGSGPLLYRNDGGALVAAGAVALDAGADCDGDDLALVDADRDGDLDLITTNGGLWSSANDGAGLFGVPRKTIAGGTGQIAVSDVDRDGLPDAVVGHAASAGLDLCLNVSTRGAASRDALRFEPTLADVALRDPVAVEIGDFNGDGHKDIATICQGDSSIALLFGHGDGSFGSPVITALGTAGGIPSELAAGDFDGDGLLDLAVLSHADDRVSTWLQSGGTGGTGSFLLGGTVTVTKPRRAAVQDFDLDGDTDLGVATDIEARVLLNDSTGALIPGSAALASEGSSGLDAAAWTSAFDATSSRADRSLAFSTHAGGDDRLGRYGVSSGGSLVSAGDWAAVAGPLAAGDFERDGRPDLAAANGAEADRPIGILRAPGIGAMRTVPGTATVPASAMAAGDVNGDGCPDLAVVGFAGADYLADDFAAGDSAAGVVSVLLGNGSGGGDLGFTPGATFSAGAGTRDIEIADFDEDGRLDIVTADPGVAGDTDRVSLFLQREDGTAPTVETDAVGSYDLSARISVTAADGVRGSGVNRVLTQLDAGAVIESPGATAAVSTATPGTHQLRVWAVDEAGNESDRLTVDFTVRRTSTLSLTTRSGTVGYLATLPISGSITGPAVSGGHTVVLEQWTSTGWAQVATAVTGSTGGFTFSRRIDSKTVYRASFAGDVLNIGSTSSSIYKLPYASLGTPVAPTGIRRGTYFTCYGGLKPRHTAGATVVRIYRQQYVRGRWVSRGYVNAKAVNYSSYSKYSARVRLEFIGKWRVRAYHADSTHAPTYSGWRTVYSR